MRFRGGKHVSITVRVDDSGQHRKYFIESAATDSVSDDIAAGQIIRSFRTIMQKTVEDEFGKEMREIPEYYDDFYLSRIEEIVQNINTDSEIEEILKILDRLRNGKEEVMVE